MKIVGQDNDRVIEERENLSLNFSRNLVVSEAYNAYVPEKSLLASSTINGKTIIGLESTSEEIVVFSTQGTSIEIGRYKEGNYTFVYEYPTSGDPEFRPIEAVHTYNFKGELIIVWWDGIKEDSTPPRILNLDCASTLAGLSNLTLLFPNLGRPNIELNEVNNTGGSLESGAYLPCIAYKLPDGSYTDFFTFGNWITIYENSSTLNFLDIEGCDPGTTTSKAIRLRITGLLDSLSAIAIGFIKKIGGIQTAIVFEDVTYYASGSNGVVNFLYDNDEGSVDVPLEQLLIPTQKFTKVQAGTVLSNRLFFANVETNEELDFQPYANNINVEWVREDDITLAQYENSYKNPVFIYSEKTFAPNEVLALYIGFKFNDGTFSKFFHIPAREPGVIASLGNEPENELISTMVSNGNSPPDAGEFTAIDPDVRYHEVFSTALQTGEMGFFENQDEFYADTDCSDIKDAGGNVIGTLRNEKVRHHRFPSFQQLDSWGIPIYTPSVGSPWTNLADIDDAGWGGNNKLDFSVTSIVGANFTATTTTDKLELTANSDFTAKIRIRLKGTFFINASGAITLTRASGSNLFLANDIVEGGLFVGDQMVLEYYGTINFKTGDVLKVEVEITGSPVLSKPDIITSILIDQDNFSDSTATSKRLGLIVSNINIPNEIKSKISTFHIAYATRTVDNSLKLGTGVVENPLYYYSGTYDELGIICHDLLQLKPAISPSYIRALYRVTGSAFEDYNAVYDTPTVESTNRRILESSFVPKNSSLPVDNEGKKEVFYTKISSNITGTPDTRAVEIYNYKKNVFEDYNNQQLTLVPQPFTPNITSTLKFYWGDHYITAAGLGKYLDNIFVVDSKINTALLYANPAEEIVDTFYDEDTVDILYNNDYTSILNILELLVFECTTDCLNTFINKFPYRVFRSLIQPSESNEFTWRKFLLEDSFEMLDRKKGAIWKLASFNRALLVHQLYSLFVAINKDKLASSLTEVFLGSGDIFDRQPEETLPSEKGYGGCQSKWAAIVTKVGYIFADQKQGKVFIFNGKLNEISAKGKKNFFRDNLGIPDNFHTDNSFTENGIILGYDERYNRVLITKLFRELVQEGIGQIDRTNSFTLQFSIEANKWICNHDYIAAAYADTLNGFISLNNSTTESKIYRHHIANTYGVQYEGAEYTSYADFIFNIELGNSKIWNSIVWETTVKALASGILYDTTVDKIVIYNNYQCTGEIDLVPFRTLPTPSANVRHVKHKWIFNKIQDLVSDNSDIIINEDGTINTSNINSSKSWFRKSNFFSKFIVIRLIVNAGSTNEVQIKNVFATFLNKDR